MADLLDQPDTDTTLCGHVVCEIVAGRSALTRVWATDPLKLLTPRDYGIARNVVLSTYGGGLLAGDRVAMRATVKANARLLVTTQSTGKIYRTDDRPSTQSFEATIDDDALLAVLPDPVCAFADARLHQTQRYDLAASGSLVYLDWLTSGRHGRGERWAMREIISRTEIHVDGKTRLRETLSLDADRGQIGSMMRLGGFDCYAVVVMIGPLVWPYVEATKAMVRSLAMSRSPELLASDSSLDNGAVFRVLGREVQTVQKLLRRLLEPMDTLLGQNPWGRKW